MGFKTGLFIIFAWCAAPIAAAPRLVFMAESDGRKQIMSAAPDGKKLEALTYGDAWHLYPALSSDGKTLAYSVAMNHRDYAIQLLQIDSGRLEQWTPADGMRLHSDFSGDGRRLIYSGPVGPNAKQGLAFVDLDAERAKGAARRDGNVDVYEPAWQVVETTAAAAYFPALSSDGHRVVYHQPTLSGRGNEVVLHDLDSNTQRTLSEPGIPSMAPAWSWDDRWVAFTEKRHEQWDIALVDLSSPTLERRRLSFPGSADLAPQFGHDGSLYFASDRSGEFRLYQITPTQLMRREPQATLITLAVDGALYAPKVSGPLAVIQSQRAQLLSPARSSFAAEVVDGQIFVTGGHQGHEHTYPRDSFLTNHEAYDPLQNIWTRKAARPEAAHGYETVAFGPYIYAFGGFAFAPDLSPKWRSLDTIDRYVIAEDRWERVAKLRQPRSSNVVVRLGTKAYIIGGWDATPQHAGDYEGRFQRQIEVFDLETQALSVHPSSLPDPLRRALSAVVLGNEIVLVGGLGEGASHFELLANVTAFEPVQGSFRELPALAFPTFAPATGRIGDQLFVFGGLYKLGPDDYNYVNHIYELSPGQSNWRHAGRYLSETKGFARVVNLDAETLAIMGGHTYEGDTDHPVASFETFAAPLDPALLTR